MNIVERKLLVISKIKLALAIWQSGSRAVRHQYQATVFIPKNELASGHFWAVSLKTPSLQENADCLKNLFIFRRKILSFFHNMLRKSFNFFKRGFYGHC